MESIKHPFPWLELLDRPAFCVKNKVVIECNSATKSRAISTGADVYDFVRENRDIYDTFENGTLCLTIIIDDLPCSANIIRQDEYDIFVLEQTYEDSQLQVLALAAQKLRIPLSNMMTATDKLLTSIDQEDDETQQMSGQINRSLFQLMRMVSNMADANGQPSTATAGMQNINLTALFDETMEKIQATSECTGKKLSYIGPDCTVIGVANEEKLGRAIYNLIANALKFSPHKSTVEAKLSKNGNTLAFAVRNFNFEPLKDFAFWTQYRREPDVEDSRVGIGLGMSLVRSAALMHGGTVLIDNPTENETRVTMTIPIIIKESSTVRSPILKISDYAGGRDKGLLELSELLPSDSYHKIN